MDELLVMGSSKDDVTSPYQTVRDELQCLTNHQVVVVGFLFFNVN